MAVTTFLPALRARSWKSSAAPVPPMSSTTTWISGSSMMSSNRVVSSAGSRSGWLKPGSFSSTLFSATCLPVASVMSSAFFLSSLPTPDPTVP